MPTLKDLENTDEQHNPSAESARDLLEREHEKIPGYDRKNDGLDDHPISAGVSSAKDPSRNIDDLKNREETSTGLYRPSKTGNAEPKQTASLKTIFKKRGPLAAIITLGLGLPTILTIFLSPALLLQQFSETLTGKFNDQLSAMDVRSTLLLKKKYGSTLTKGQCGTKVTILCRYQSVRENSGLAKRLRNAGVEIEGDRSIVPGRVKPKVFIFEGQRIPASNLLREARTNPGLRSALRKGYDPIFAGFSDKLSTKIRVSLGLKKSSNVGSSTDKDKMNEDLKKTAAGTNNIPEGGKLVPAGKDDNGNPIFKDADGNIYPEAEANRLNALIGEGLSRNALAEKVTKSAVKSSLKGVLTTTAFGAGAIDSACTAWTMIRVAAFAAKYYQQRQLIRYAYEFMKVSHKQKYGDLTQEEMTFYGNKLTQVNSEGQAALDSDGYKLAAYGDAFSVGSFKSLDGLKEGDDLDKVANEILLENESSRYVNGQLLNSNVISKIAGLISNSDSGGVAAADKTCKFTKSWKGQALVFGLAIAGAFVAVFTGGLSVGAGAIAQGAVSIAISVAFALLQPKLIDMAKGEVIKGDENGNETGNAVVSGMGGYNAQTAQGRGLRVASQNAYSAYNKTNTEVAAKYAQEDRESLSPFDASSKNTFLGGVVANLLPYSTKMQNPGSSVLAITSMVGTTLSSLGMSGKASAASDDQFTQCDDNEYKTYAADPFCNLRYMLPDMDTDPEDVLKYMIDGNYITDDDPTPQGEYADYVARCIDRKTSIGDEFTNFTDGESEGGGDPGKDCVVGQGGADEKRNTMFSLFYVDSSVDEGFDNDFDEVTTNSQLGTEFRVASFNMRGASHDGENGTPPWEGRIENSVATIKSNDFDIVGFQEFEAKQYTYVKQNMPDYELSSHGKESDSIMWKTSRFSVVKKGTWKTTYFGGPIQEPWVKLKDNATSQEFFVLNVHDPINKGQGSNQTRYENALAHLELINTLKTEAPVVFTGDFNSAYSNSAGAGAATAEKLTYCVLTSSGSVNDAYDLSVPRPAKCPNEPGGGVRNYIDHIYLTPEIQVSSFKDVPSDYSVNGSDHPTIYADVVIPGVAESSGAGTNFVIGTYNQPIRGTSRIAYEKIKENKMDIIGMQELGGPNYFDIKNSLAKDGYEVYPSIKQGENDSALCSNARPIFYNASSASGTSFKLVRSEIFDVPSYETTADNPAHPPYVQSRQCGNGEITKGGGRANVPIIWLQDNKTGQTIIVMNTHNLANCCGSAGVASKKRYESSQIYVNKITELKTANPGVPIFFSGDFNEGTGVRRSGNVTYQLNHSNLLYCMFKSNGLMFRAIGSRDQQCQTDNEGIGQVDFIYATPGVKVEWTKEFLDPSTNQSPHPVHFGKLVVPGTGAATGPITNEGWVWPVPDVKSLGTLGYGERNSDGQTHKGIDIGQSGGASLGKTVVAAHAGTVNNVWGSGSDCGTFISIKAEGTTYYAAYQHVRNLKVRQGDPVTAGQPIAEIGRQGGSTCGSKDFFHLHFSIESKPSTVSEYADTFPNGTIDPLKVLPR